MVEQAEVDRSPVKIAVLGFITAVFALIFGYTLSRLLSSADLPMTAVFIGAAVFFLASSLLLTFFVHSVSVAVIVFAVSVLAIAAIFLKFFSGWLFLGSLLLFLFLLEAYLSGCNELKNTFKIKFFRAGRRTIGKASTALAIFVTIIYVLSFRLDDPAAIKSFIAASIRPVQPLIEQIYSQFSSFSQFAPASFIKLPSTPEITDLISKAAIAKLKSLPKIYRQLIAFSFGLLVFLTLKSLLFIINYLALFLAYVFYEILKSLGFFYIALESRAKEVIVVK